MISNLWEVSLRFKFKHYTRTGGAILCHSFVAPWKHQNTRGFLMFSGSIKREQWHEISYKKTRFINLIKFINLIRNFCLKTCESNREFRYADVSFLNSLQ